MTKTINLTKQLVQIPSITPNDKGAQDILIKRLEAIGFVVEKLKFGKVDNFFARYGTVAPLFVFAGHTDVVPVGDEQHWNSPPFSPTITDGMLYGRGVADMKGSIAAMVVAVEGFLECNTDFNGSIGFLITADEEGDAIDGTKKVMQHLYDNGTKIDYCLVGEPSSAEKLGDTIKVGRRGSLNAKLQIIGKQGHIAYPQLACNPIPKAIAVLNNLCAKKWDNGNEYFEPTSMQISNINAGTGVTNVIPETVDIMFNFRYSSESNHIDLQNIVVEELVNANIKYSLDWQHSGAPFLTKKAHLVDVMSNSIFNITGIKTHLSTSGGTSDGRFIAPYGIQVVEFGVLNATIHQIDECAAIADLEQLSVIYSDILANIF